MLEHIRVIASMIFLSIPFFYVLDFVFNIVQIPFALIHRYAAGAVFVYKMYLLCQFYSMLTFVYVGKEQVNAIVLLVVSSLILWFTAGSAMYNTQRSGASNWRNQEAFVGIVSLSCVPALWIIYYLRITFLSRPVLWFLQAIEAAYRIPIIGGVLSFFTRATAGTAVISIVVIVGIALVTLFANVFTSNKN